MSLTAAQSKLMLQKWADKQDKQGQWDRKQLQTLLTELEAGPKAKSAPKPTPRGVVSTLLQQGSGHQQAQNAKAAAFGKQERDARKSRERVAKQHATAAKKVAITVPAANPTAARPATAAPQGIAAIPFFQTRQSRPRSTSASRCRSCSRSPEHGAVAPHSPPSATHPPVSIKSIHPHEFVVGIGDCRPEGAVGVGHQAREASPTLSPPRVQMDQQAAYERQQKQARRLQMSKQAQEAAWLDPRMSHVSAATLHHMHDPAAKQPKQPKKKRSSKGIQSVAAAASSAEEQAQLQKEWEQLQTQDGPVDASSLPPAGLPTAISSAREGALKFIASPTSRATTASPTRVASNFPATSSAAYGAGVLSPRRAAAGGFVPQPHVPQKSQHNAASINVFAHDDNGQGALAEERGGVTNSYRELQERIKHNQYRPATAAPRPTVSMAPAAGIRSAVEPPYKGPAATAAPAPARPVTAPAYPAHAAWEEERIALLKELTAAQLRENASQAELNARKTRPEGAVAWWPQDDADDDAAQEGAMTERMRMQREQIHNMQAAAALARAKQDKIERDQAAKENAARAASPPRSARYRRGASVGPVIKSPPFAHVGPEEARAYSATIRAAGSSPPHSHGGAHEQHRYNLHHRRDSEVSEGEYSFKNVDGELADQLRESLRKDVAREAAEEDAAYNARSQRRAAAMAGGGLDDEFKQFDDEDRKAAAAAAGAASISRQGEPSMRVGSDFTPRVPVQGSQAFFIPAGPASRAAPPLRRGEVSQSFQVAPSAAAGFGPAVDAQAHELAESFRQRAAADQLKSIIDKHEHEQAEQRRQAAGLARQSADAHAWINRFEMEAGMPSSLPAHPPPPSASFRASVAPLPPAPAQAPTMHSSFSASRGPGYSQSADTSIESVMQMAHNPIIKAFKRDPTTVRMPPATVAAVAVAAAAAVEATVGPNSPLRSSRNPRSARSSPARGGVSEVVRQFSPSRSVGAASSSLPYRPLSPPARVSDLSDVSSNVSQLSSAPAVPMTAAALASQQKLDWYSAELARLQERQVERERQQQAQLPPAVAAAAVPSAASMSHYSSGPVPPTNGAAAEAALAASSAFGDAASTARASAEARSRERARLENEYADALRTQREQAERKMEDLTRKMLQSSVGKSHGLSSPSRTTAIPPVVAAFVPPMASTGAGVGGVGAGVGAPSSFVVSVRPASSFAPPASTAAPSAPAPAPSQSLNASYLSQISSMGASSSSMRSSFGPGAPPRHHHPTAALDLDTPSELSSASSEEEEQLRRATNASRGLPARGAGAGTGSTLASRGVYAGARVESGEDSDVEDDEGAAVAVATAAAAAHLDDTLDDGDDVNGSLASVGTDEDAELDEESESYFSSHVKRTYEVTVTVDEAKR